MGRVSKSGGDGCGGEVAVDSSGAELKKLIQSLREAVNKNYTDDEIQAVLEECHMDANEAAQRLISQESFQEVKSKRQRRKEMKETQESRARRKYSAPMSGNGCDSSSADNNKRSIGKSNAISLPNQQTSGFQPNWSVATSAHVSMADVVRMGKSNSKSSHVSSEASYMPQDTVGPYSSQLHPKPLNVTSLPGPETQKNLLSLRPSNSSETTVAQCGFDDEQFVMEQLTDASTSSPLDSSDAVHAKICYNQIDIYTGRATLSGTAQSDEFQVSRDDVECQKVQQTSHSVSHSEDRKSDISRVATSLQHLSFGKDEPGTSLAEERGPIPLPDDMPDFDNYFSHLNLGTYVASSGSTNSGPLASAYGSSTVDLYSRTLEDLTGEGFGSMHYMSRKPAYPNRQSELMNQNISEATGGPGLISSSMLDPNLNNIQQVSSPLSSLMDPMTRNLGSLPSELVMSSDSFSLFQPSTTQVLPGANSATRPVLNQHLSAHSYSNIPNPLMRPDYTPVESARKIYTQNTSFPPDRNPFHDYLLGQNQQYRDHVNLGSFPPNRIASDYGSFPGSLRVGYEDVFLSQYRHGSKFPSNQNDASASWNYGLGSRTMSGVPESAHYDSLLRRNQQHNVGYAESLGSPQSYRNLGYPSTYGSNFGITPEQLRRSLDPNLSGFQGPSSKPSDRPWDSKH